MSDPQKERVRIRTLIPSLNLGDFPPGPWNSLTDVPGVLVHTESIIAPRTDEHHEINTGVTAILPRRNVIDSGVFASIFSFNGAGEMTGSHWLAETGLLHTPIAITGTLSVGAAHEGVTRYFIRETKDSNGLAPDFALPVVAETWDGFLSDAGALPVRPEHVVKAIDAASSDAVKEGNTGGGTAMMAHGLKAGTGSASRVVPVPEGWEGPQKAFTIGVLVQANYGRLPQFRVGGVPVGRKLLEQGKARDGRKQEPIGPQKDGSIIVIVATDAPLLPHQLHRIAKRATVGLARVGGTGFNYSGDVFLAFSTASEIPGSIVAEHAPRHKIPDTVADHEIDSLFAATADAVEESIYNAICMAQTTTGPLGRKVEAVDLEALKEAVEAHL
ncbi:hypothetical protein FH972_023532 [Carpinus fangiana]|uniref:Uncharacterized protein n=1 Tax=Carpinus fangiana TaxID=176857 RepID=A0A5N6KVU6_9ROSI|nr:hypothetical protein FH972_023532 [Carpinus fangiana]